LEKTVILGKIKGRRRRGATEAEMGILDHFTCLLRNLCSGQEATIGTLHGTTNWFKIGNGVCQGCILCILSPCLFNF